MCSAKPLGVQDLKNADPWECRTPGVLVLRGAGPLGAPDPRSAGSWENAFLPLATAGWRPGLGRPSNEAASCLALQLGASSRCLLDPEPSRPVQQAQREAWHCQGLAAPFVSSGPGLSKAAGAVF